MDKQNLVNTHNTVLFSIKMEENPKKKSKEKSFHIQNEWNKPVLKINFVGSHLCEISKFVKFIETENRMELQGLGR